jgi:uncharacterized membrane protein
MGFGPVDVIIIGFPGNKFNGQIAPALLELVENKTIRLIDLLFVSKDLDGTVTTLEIADLDPAHGPAYLEIAVTHAGALDHEDAQELSEDLEPGSSALLVAFENTWAAKFADAIIASDAVVIDTIRIPAAVVDDFVASAFE